MITPINEIILKLMRQQDMVIIRLILLVDLLILVLQKLNHKIWYIFENELILAEAKARQGSLSDGLTHLNNVRILG